MSNITNESCNEKVVWLGKIKSYLLRSKLASLQMRSNKSVSFISGLVRTIVFWLNGRFTWTHLVSSKGLELDDDGVDVEDVLVWW